MRGFKLTGPVIIILIVLTAAPFSFSRDILADFVKENYKEVQAEFSYDPVIYHSIQVNTEAGPKLVILDGADYLYRTWLRHYLARDAKLILRVADEQNDTFIASKAFNLNVNSVHPINGNKWTPKDLNAGHKNQMSGTNHILVIDRDTKRQTLIQSVAKASGYQTVMFKTMDEAVAVFKLQPEKFTMVVIQHDTIEPDPVDAVGRITKVDHTVPVLIDTGYTDKGAQKEYAALFSKIPTVHIKPVILRELAKTIQRFSKDNA